MISMMSKTKIRADDFISIVLIISILVIALTFDKITITAIFIYPMIAFLAHGIIRIHKGINKKDLTFW